MGRANAAPDFFSRPGLNVEVYDVRAERDVLASSVAGDVDFYVEEALRRGGPVLELGCGTGRVALPMAAAGLHVVGLDLSAAMLEVAEAKRAAADVAVRERLRFARGDMARFDVGGPFGMVFVAFRAFQVLLTPEAQRSCLTCAHRHLAPGGTLILDLFDPKVEWLAPGRMPPPKPEREGVRHPRSGNEVRVRVIDRVNDAFAQVLVETWRHEELAADGTVLRSEDEALTLRWTYREEMRYLLELCGFDVEALWSDFRRSPPAYGSEQVWVARRR